MKTKICKSKRKDNPSKKSWRVLALQKVNDEKLVNFLDFIEFLDGLESQNRFLH